MPMRIVTISREFGSGGRTVGMAVAERLGVVCYDRSLIARIAGESGLDPGYIAQFGEYATSTSRMFSTWDAQGLMPGTLSIPDQLYLTQHKILRELADQGPCVIVGRGADAVLEGRDDCLHVFLHADESFRADRIVRLYGETAVRPVERLREMDKKRRIYYEHYSGREWGRAQNYHLCLRSSAIGIERCVEVIASLAHS